MLIILPIVLLIPLSTLFLGLSSRANTKSHPWQCDFLLAFSIWPGYLVVLTEGPSFISKLSLWPIAAGWSLALTAILAMGIRSGHSSAWVSGNALLLPFLEPLRDRLTLFDGDHGLPAFRGNPNDADLQRLCNGLSHAPGYAVGSTPTFAHPYCW